MPLATRPNQKYEVVLSTDVDLPKEKQPVFIFRYLSIKKWEEIANLDTAFEVAADPVMMVDIAFQAIEKTLCGWRNMRTPAGEEIPYNPKELKAMVSMLEIIELMQAAVAQRPSLEDKKKFDLQSDSDTAESARPAKDSKNAGTGQQ